MAVPIAPAPSTTYLQSGNAQLLLSWQPVSGADSYSVQRSTDGGVTWTEVATPEETKYLDEDVEVGTQYWYQVAAVSGSDTSSYTVPSPSSEVPVTAGTMALVQIRRLAQQRADLVNSNFVTLPEWNRYINLAADELYDLITTTYEDYNVYSQPVYFTTDGTSQSFTLPNGQAEFTLADGTTVVPPPIYKLHGIDLGINAANNAYVTVPKFNFIDRNRFVFPNSSSTIYGIFNMRYRLVGNTIRFIPTPAANQQIGIWYVPRRTQMLEETDTCDGYGGWNQYIVVRAAKYALDKQESDTSKLDEELLFLKERIEGAAPNRDDGQPDTISDSRGAEGGIGPNGGFSGPFGTGY